MESIERKFHMLSTYIFIIKQIVTAIKNIKYSQEEKKLLEKSSFIPLPIGNQTVPIFWCLSHQTHLFFENNYTMKCTLCVFKNGIT